MAAGADAQQAVTVEVARTVRIADPESGKVIYEMTNRNGDVSIKRVAQKGTVRLDDLAKAVAQL